MPVFTVVADTRGLGCSTLRFCPVDHLDQRCAVHAGLDRRLVVLLALVVDSLGAGLSLL